MSPVQKSGLYYPNKFGLITLKSLEEVMGKNGLNAILNFAGMNNYIESYPPDNLDKGFDFSELSALGTALGGNVWSAAADAAWRYAPDAQLSPMP